MITIGRRYCLEYEANTNVKQIIVTNMSDLSTLEIDSIGTVDIAFDLIATPVKDAFKGEKLYRSIDVDMASEFARFSKEAGAKFIGL